MNKGTYSGMLELLDRDDSEMLLIGSEGDSEEDGGKPDADEDLDGDGDGKDADGKSADDDGDGDDDKSGESVTALKRQVANLQESLDRNVSKRKEAQAEVVKVKAELDTLKKSGAGDAEAQKAMDALTQENEGLHAQVADMRLENAFLKDNTFKWQDPKAALKLADLSDVEIDKDGSVHGLGTALEKLSVSSPWLVRKEDDDGKGDAEDGKDKKPPVKKSGSASGSSKDRQKSSSAERAKKYTAKYPGLRR